MHVHEVSHVIDVYLATYIVKLYFLFFEQVYNYFDSRAHQEAVSARK